MCANSSAAHHAVLLTKLSGLIFSKQNPIPRNDQEARKEMGPGDEKLLKKKREAPKENRFLFQNSLLFVAVS